MSKTYQTAAGGLNASFAVTGEGLFLAGLTDGKSSRAYLRAPQPLFTLEYECLESGARETVSSADGWTVAVVDADADARLFTLSDCAKLPGVILRLAEPLLRRGRIPRVLQPLRPGRGLALGQGGRLFLHAELPVLRRVDAVPRVLGRGRPPRRILRPA